MMRASLIGALILSAMLAVPGVVADGLSDCTGSPIGEGIYVSGCTAYAVDVAFAVVDLVFCFYNTAPSQWFNGGCVAPLA